MRYCEKIVAAINNVHCLLDIKNEYGFFSNFIWVFVEKKTINNSFRKSSELPGESKESILMSIELRKRGFQFVGPKICYAFMQATGLVNDHLISCVRHKELQEKDKQLIDKI